MRVPLYLLSFISLLSFSACALDLKGSIHWNEHCPSLSSLGQARVVLDSGALQGGVTRDGGFVIPEVPAGTYVLSVIAHGHVFDKLRVDVHPSDSLPEIHPYIPGTPLASASTITLPYPITLSASQKLDFYTPRQAFNLMGMFKNPMMLMMVLGGVLVFAMPYIMKNMDPEMLKDFEERQARISSIQSSLQSGDLKSGFSALMQAAEDEGSTSTSRQAGPSPSGVKQRGGKNKKR